MKLPRIANLLPGRKAKPEEVQESESKVETLDLHRHDDHHYDLTGGIETFARTWVAEGIRGKVIYTFHQEIDGQGSIVINQQVRLLSLKPVAPGQEPGMEGAIELEPGEELHPILRTDHASQVYRELESIYLTGLPA